MVRLARVVVVCAWLVIIPAAAYAQASITGVVRDASGAVIPGVTVEAASPALIEKVRSVVTDGGGQYRLVTLPPGIYTVTFTLSGFSTLRREGVELTGTFTAAINADLRVGSLEETVTVTSETPLVDIQGTTQQRVVGAEVVDAVPSGRMPSSFVVLIPGINVTQGAGNWYGLGAHDVGGSVGDIAGIYAIHGGSFQDSRMMINGVSTGWGNEAFETGYSPNMSAIQEVVVDTAASAEASEGGVRTNIVPRDGGNAFSGTIFGSFTNEHLTADNLDDDLTARGLAHANSVKLNGDFNPGFGGPIRRDALWFYTAVRYLRADNYVGGVFVDKTAGRPERLGLHARREPEGRQQRRLERRAGARDLAGDRGAQVRVLVRAADLLQVSVAHLGHAGRGYREPVGTAAASVTADWTAPLTNRLLFDASVLQQINKSGFFPRATASPLLIGFLEQSTGMNVKTRTGDYREQKNHAALSLRGLVRDRRARVQVRGRQRVRDGRLRQLRHPADPLPAQ